jgi:hypothetical protein
LQVKQPFRVAIGILAWMITAPEAFAQNERRVFVGALFGIATLSADGGVTTAPPNAALSNYEPQNGLTLNVFAGAHLAEYFSLQGSYMGNRNDLTLVSSFVTPQGGGFYEQRRTSAQHAVVADALIYFRRIDNRVRPYLGTGLAIVRFNASVIDSTSNGLTAPAGDITATNAALRSHVGIDLRLSSRTAFRYSFSETIGGNPVSPHLSPPGQRSLMNFQNLFGIVARF